MTHRRLIAQCYVMWKDMVGVPPKVKLLVPPEQLLFLDVDVHYVPASICMTFICSDQPVSEKP
jgi:hypothetical protein